MPATAKQDTVLTTEDGLPASRFPVAISETQARSIQDGRWNPLDDLAALGAKLSSSSAAQARSGSVTSWTEVESVLRDGPIIDLGHQDVFAKPPSLWQKVVKFFSTPDYSGYSDQALAQVDTWAARTEYSERMLQRQGRPSMGSVLPDFFVRSWNMAAGMGVGGMAFNALRGARFGYAVSGMGAGIVGDLTTQVADNAAYQASGGRVGRDGLDKTELALSAVLPLAAELPGVARGGAERLRALGVPDWEVKLRQQDFGVLNSNPLPFELERVVPNRSTPVERLDVGTYGELAPRSVGDGLTPDHIPSFAAVKSNVEQQLGRALTPAEARELRNNTNALVIETELHQQISRTYGGRNTAVKIQQDSMDLGAAARADEAMYRERLYQHGYTEGQLNAAFQRLHEANQKKGLY
ncbi:hypothetical protein [Chromobacterium vaccinii]